MVDKFDKKTRSRVMAAIKNKNTKPEVNIRKALFAKGLRYRIHNKKLPGCPDIVFPKYKAVIFIHGCFWHNHDCKHGQLPKSNVNFWEEKLQKNVERDKKNIQILKYMGWKVKIIWSCKLKNKKEFQSIDYANDIVEWIKDMC
ncbi:MAG: Very short patch repair protein [Candidatus Anoxychlamydiales bacterium]|nr:Very short patch repair protein [Candidatus Anoxychlamydiales bacterium]